MIVPSTVRRVPDHTTDAVNDDIRRQTRRNVARFASASPQAIERRLHELDQEWDIERVLETNASIAVLTSLGLGVAVDRRWLAVTGLVGAFLLQHAVQGWCPPMPILRRMGFRTSYEIDEERYALKALRGDFADVVSPPADDEEIHALERLEGEGGPALELPPATHRDPIDRAIEAVGAR